MLVQSIIGILIACVFCLQFKENGTYFTNGRGKKCYFYLFSRFYTLHSNTYITINLQIKVKLAVD